ncbi:MAG: RagB/SusD family nutrient uptake outer membrane protein [Peptostreptococcaceae bacterium]|nr:RagB/SusD family nutrient uptake outer membrane protein [Peptostreptococcaceae bacterium]
MKYILLMMLVSGLMLGSCTKFLEETPTGTLNVETELTSYESGLALANGTYRSLPNWIQVAGDGFFGNLPASFEYATGKAYSTYAQTLLWRFESDGMSGDVDYFIKPWDNWYGGVRDCNLAIKMIPQITGMSADEKSKVLGEVHTLRAFYYFCLVRFYGDVIYNTDVLADVNQASLPRTSLKTIYDKIIVPDLEYAINESSLVDAKSTDGHVTKYVSRVIMADVYLTMAGYPYQEVNADTTKNWCTDGLWTMTDYPVNTTSAKDLLQKAKTQLDFLYGLYPIGNFSDINNPALDNKGGAIFQAQFQSGVRNNDLIVSTLPQGSGCSVFPQESGSFVPSLAYVNSYNPADKRVKDKVYFFYSDTKAKLSDPNEGPCEKFSRPYLYKYYDYEAIKYTGTSSLNWNFYRYADLLLMLTEVNWTLNQLGVKVPDADIVKGINEVRTRALMPTYLAADLTLIDIMSERAYELIFENKMIFDMRRTRKALIDGSGKFAGLENFIGHQPTNFNFAFSAKHLLSPVSSTEIDNNRLCLQNYGWAPKQIGQ